MENSLHSILLVMGSEELLFFLGEVIEAEYLLTVKARTLHHAIRFEFVRCNDGPTGRTGVGNNVHR